MGTNFYVRFEPCKTCGRSDEEYHIGKSSGGWCFTLHVEPDENINTLEDVKKIWEKSGSKIYDEYGGEISSEKMMEIITDRKWKRKKFMPDGWYKSEEEFYEKNHAVKGPNGLVRHKIDGDHCIGHGEGTWDYITGEFS